MIITAITSGAPHMAEEVTGKIRAIAGATPPNKGSAKVIRLPRSIPAMAPCRFALPHQMPSKNTGNMVLPARAKATAMISTIMPGGWIESSNTTTARKIMDAFGHRHLAPLGSTLVDDPGINIKGEGRRSGYEQAGNGEESSTHRTGDENAYQPRGSPPLMAVSTTIMSAILRAIAGSGTAERCNSSSRANTP